MQFLQLEKHGTATVVRLTTTTLEPEVSRQISRLFRDAVQPIVHLDLGRVEFVTAEAIGKLITLRRELHDLGGSLTIRNVNPHIYEVFQLVRLTNILNIENVPALSA